MQVFNCSPMVRDRIKSYDDTKAGLKQPEMWAKYPWSIMQIGQCFIERFEVANEGSLRSLAAQQKSKTGKTFVVIKHLDLQIFEIARIA